MYTKIVIPDRLKEIYDLQLSSQKKDITRFFCFLVLAITITSSIVDFWALPSTFIETNVVRGLLLVVEVFILWAIYQPNLSRYYSHFQHILLFGPAFSVVYILHISNTADTGHYIYASFLVLLIMLFFSWSTLSIKELIVNTALIILSYTLSTFTHLAPGADKLSCLACYIPTVFAMLAAAVAGYFGKSINENNTRQNFLSKYSLQQSLQAQQYYANHDELTGLSNRRGSERFFENDIHYAKKHGLTHFVMLLDLNGFKAINDEYGHGVGDEVLKVTAKRFKSCLRRGDSISRIGGDEFAISVVLNNNGNYCVDEISNKISNKIQQRILQPIVIDNIEVSVGTSVGIASFPNDADNFEDLLKIADQRMYDNKRMQNIDNKALKRNRDVKGIRESVMATNVSLRSLSV